MYCFDGIYKECKKHQIRFWRFTGSKKIYTGISFHAPVIVFTASVNSRKWFFMQQYLEFMTTCNTIHNIHHKYVVIYCQINFFEDGSNFKLRWSNFIMTCAKRNTKSITFFFIITHEGINSFWYRTKIMIFQLLALCRSCTKY